MIVADERKLRQILVNLLSNAVKFTPPGGKICIRCASADDGGLLLSVTDSGQGMTHAEMDVALERFGRVEKSGTRGIEGFGLGLPLTRALVELHGGTLELSSEPGSGTKATVAMRSLEIGLPNPTH
ncbi:MAG: ATP-binding protein [Rhodospirillaceae bacterium]|jgi:two-component system, cell cycle sensor histidine kinase PleC|nr:ATP-binding protein [Rhodospirillaceae bacterium]MBT6205831.1 ATP-binding protein [Rhodospirillaceae bacterium]MBT6511082.1 ATP-binding protein [Rhodospirillaceae bacterium]MBT7614596.1 ATP-binding protein [Rhodospirillaceae bacterium]MBT7647398.1 ATP-binding protein [Rhodospirillaceae bacterium]